MMSRKLPVRRLLAILLGFTLAAAAAGPGRTYAQSAGPGGLDPSFHADSDTGHVRAVTTLPNGQVLIDGTLTSRFRTAP